MSAWFLVVLVGLLALLVGCGSGVLEERARRQARPPGLAPIPLRRKGKPNPTWLQ